MTKIINEGRILIEYVIKNDGSKEKFDANKLNRWSKYAARSGGDWSQIAIETFKRLPVVASSKDIHETMLAVCYSKEDIEYSRIAARLEVASIRKNMERHLGLYPNKDTFETIRNKYLESGVWCSDTIPPYSAAQEALYEEIKPVKMEAWQVAQWGDKYLRKINHEPVETPHLAAMGIGLGLLGDNEDGHNLVRNIVNSKINLPTPAMNGIRNGDFDTISCAVMESGDSIESIAVADHLAMRLTGKKSGIGIRYNTRSKGADVKGGLIQHLGKHPIYKSLDASVKTFTQVSRGGSATVAFSCIDPEAQNILLWKSQRSDIDTRIDRLDYSFAFNDAFLDAVVKREPWWLFDYKDAPEVHTSFYRDSVEDYNRIVQEALDRGIKAIKLEALGLLKEMLVIRNETGRMYCFNVSRGNEHTPFEDVIKLSNLCVAPETKILTTTGYEVISDLEGENVVVWNGEQWSATTVVKTGQNQKLITVKTSSGQDLTCTEYHKFYVQRDRPRGAVVEKRAHELSVGDKLIKFDLPVIHGEDFLENAYGNGFYSGDGCFFRGVQMTYLYHDKRNLLSYLGDVRSVNENERQNRTTVTHNGNLKDKFFVPLNSYSVESRLDWLAGLMDSDGTVARNGDNESLQVSSVHLEFLREVHLMLQTLGVSSKISLVNEEGYQKMPLNDGSGELGDFFCKDAWRLLISSSGLFKLSQMGFKTNRLVWEERKPQRNAEHFVTVVGVEDEGRYDDTFCFSEPKRHMGMFNGLLTGQCQEIMLPTVPYVDMLDLYGDGEKSQGETAFCALSALVPSNITRDEYYDVAYNTVLTVSTMIMKTPKMTPNHKKTMLRRMSLGIGITGLAECLYQNGLDYDGSDESLEFVHDLIELHSFSLYKASIDLVKLFGAVDGITNWLPIDTKRSKWDNKQDWESIRGKPRANSVLTCIQPCESSSLASGKSNSVYPPRAKVVNKKSRKGIVQFICDEFVEGKHLTAWDVDGIVLSRYYGIIQDFVDQAISCDTYFDPERFEGEKKPLSQVIKEWVAHFRLGNKTMYYVNTRDKSAGGLQSIMDAEFVEEACESCTL